MTIVLLNSGQPRLPLTLTEEVRSVHVLPPTPAGKGIGVPVVLYLILLKSAWYF